jgi:circadian clock protein KaiC
LSGSNQPASGRISTGVAGLDEIVGGGLPTDRLYLIQGEPGTGKTTLALQYLIAGRDRGEKGLFITLSETEDELKAVAASHGWSLEGIQVFELSAAQQNRTTEQNTLFHPSEVELNEVTQVLLDEVARIHPQRVVLDSLSELRLLAQNALRFRRQILALKQHFVGKMCTVLLLDDKLGAGNDAQAHTVAHGVLELEQQAPAYGAERRRLRIMKLRGVRFRGGFHDYNIEKGGLRIFPRLVAAHHKAVFERSIAHSGIAGFDKLLGGGLDRGTATLIMGPAGCGKTSISMQYVAESAKRGEHAAIFLFDENIHTLLTRAAGMNMNLAEAVEQKRVTLRQIDPAEMPVGEFVQTIKDVVDKEEARVIVIDSLNGYLNAMPADRFLTVHMHEMLTYLAQQGVLTILIMAQHGMVGKMDSPIDVSYLADNVVLMRYFEAHGAIHQAVSVMKKRTGAHERTIREFQITSNGIRVGEPLENFHGILTGVPTFTGKTNAMMKPDHGG